MIEWLYTIVAYIANASPTLAVFTDQHPISARLLGKGKTIEGLLIGINFGLIVALLLGLDFRLGFIIALATQAGDLLGSFIKRRLGYKRGVELPLMDQLGFIVMVFFALSFIVELNYFWVLVIIPSTYFIHRLVNIIGYKLGVKSVPW